MPLKKSGGPVLGLDIGSSTIKACEIDVRGGRAHLRGIAVVPTPEGAVVNDEIVDPVALGKAISQILRQSGIKCRKVVTCVSGQSSLVVRIIEVPKMTRAELQETMKWEIERHVPFASEQVVMDYQPLVSPDEVPDGQNMEVLLAVAQEASVMKHLEAIQAAGLKPIAIDIEPLAASRSLIDLVNGEGPGGTVALVNIGASTTDIGIYKEGRIAFTRTIQLAGNNLTKAISDVLGVPLAEAERLKKDLAAIPDQPQQSGPGFGDDFGSDFGMPTLDFGEPADANMGGTFGTGGAPGASTATDTHAEPEFDVAGGGFSPDVFTTPTDTATGDEAPQSPFDTGADAALSGPVPAQNPFDVPADEPAAAPAAPGASPFDSSLFGPVPGADPFASPGGLDDFGVPAAQPAAAAAPEGVSEEEYLKTQVADAVMPVLHDLVSELRRSLDFYRNRANGLGAQQVVVTGGTAKLPGLADFLAANLEAPVVVGNPLQYLETSPKTDRNYLQDVGPVFPVSVGLAVRELLADTAPPRKKP